MKSLKLYNILTYILLPFGFLFGINALSSILGTLTNPPLLVISFIMACMPIYIFTSSYFFFYGVKKAKPCKASLKEWIKANAVVTIIFAALMLLCSLMVAVIFTNPQMFMDALRQMSAQQQNQLLAKISPAEILKALKLFVILMLPISIILIIHIIMTFKMLKLYNHVFDKG